MPIKVLHVVNVDKPNYYLNNLAYYSDPAEVECSFVTFAAEGCDFVRDIRDRGWRVFGFDSMGKKQLPAAFRKLWKLLRQVDPDIVHTHLFEPSLVGLTAAKWQGRKTVLTRHHSDALYKLSSAKRRFYLMLENYISRRSDHIIAPSKMVRDILVEREKVPDNKVTIIPYGQTTERFDAVTPEMVEKVRDELGMRKNLALVCTSRLYHAKGHKYLFEAFAELVKQGLDATLYLVGTGDYRPNLEEMTRQLKIDDRVKFLGWRDDALAVIAAADIVVHPSMQDALSSAVIESLMLEKPIVATDISGVRDSLDDGKYGEIVPPADSAGFQRGLEKVIGNLDAERARVSEGRKYLLRYMDAERVSDSHTRLYASLTVDRGD